jgi:hypothetical protein
MADDRYYRPGSHYVICDQSGFKTRSERARKEWQGLVVNSRFFEPRQPQDLVTGVRDDQTVPDARPRQKNVFTYLATYVTGAASIGAHTVPVSSGVGFTFGMPVQVMLDNGSTWNTYVASSTGSSITFLFSLPWGISGFFENQILSLGAAGSLPYLTDDQGNLVTDDLGNPVNIT